MMTVGNRKPVLSSRAFEAEFYDDVDNMSLYRQLARQYGPETIGHPDELWYQPDSAAEWALAQDVVEGCNSHIGSLDPWLSSEEVEAILPHLQLTLEQKLKLYESRQRHERSISIALARQQDACWDEYDREMKEAKMLGSLDSRGWKDDLRVYLSSL